jgi:hypothetical protein
MIARDEAEDNPLVGIGIRARGPIASIDADCWRRRSACRAGGSATCSSGEVASKDPGQTATGFGRRKPIAARLN